MLIHTLALYIFLTVGIAAQPQSFSLDMGSIDSGNLDSPAPQPRPNITSVVISPYIPTQTAIYTSDTSTNGSAAVTNSSSTALLNSTTSTTCLPTTVVIVTLPNPTPVPTPNTDISRSDDGAILTDDEADDTDAPFNTADDEVLSAWPDWFTAATFTLVFYDLLTLGVFIWLWAFGYLWWLRRGGAARADERQWRRRGAVSEGSIEMGRMGFGRDERTSEWARTGRGHGRVRSESWERVRGQREVELEREMVRLGMM